MFNKTVCGSPATETNDKRGGEQMLKVNEIFGPTIQGEGRTVGKEVKFLRTSGCNLACVWCDTPYTWDFKNHDIKKETTEMSVEQIREVLDSLGKDVRSLVISGGEPLIQQKKLEPLLQNLKDDGYWVEIETNGTIMPNENVLALIDQINCSPKLSNSENPQRKREKEQVLMQLAQEEKATFKFVVSNDTDAQEVLHLVEKYQMKNVYLMPLGKTKKEQRENQGKVQVLCNKYGFSFSPRLHVLKWDTKRAV